MLFNAVFLIFGLIFLVKGSDWFVEAIAVIARKLGVSEFIIGLTIVAFGTSIPELGSSITASIKGEGELVLGNIIGSNIANIGLVIGLAAIFKSLHAKTGLSTKDCTFMLVSMGVFWAFLWDGKIQASEGFICLLIYSYYIGNIFGMKPHTNLKKYLRSFANFFWHISHLEWKSDKGFGLDKFAKINIFKSEIHKDFTIALISAGLIYVGAKYFINSAIFFAELLDIPKKIIGLTIVAVGTSLPELSVSITAAKKGHGEIVIGNVIGSNIANTLLITGVAAWITTIHAIENTIWFTVPSMIILSIIFSRFLKNGITRSHGFILIATYIVFMTVQIFLAK